MAETTQNRNWLAIAVKTAREWTGIAKRDAEEIDRQDFALGYDAVNISMLLGTGPYGLRSRVQVYLKWQEMLSNPVIYTAIRLHVTQALGGHETTGDTVFIEKAPNETDPKRLAVLKDLQDNIAPLINKVAHTVGFQAAGFGDSYARVYSREGEGVIELMTTEQLYPPLVQPYERGSVTAGFVVGTGPRMTERLTIHQAVRCKMPRQYLIPQMRAQEKSLRVALTEDDPAALPLLPAEAGGSLLEACEEPYDALLSAMSGLKGQRILATLDEVMLGVDMSGMTKQQGDAYLKSLKVMLTKMKERAEEAVRTGQPQTQRHYHVMPTFGEKQVTNVSSLQGATATNSMTIEDIMLYARLLAGALGIDLSQLGFADLLSGGMGDGGFFRTSAQAAERSRVIRTALTGFIHAVIDLHCLRKYGWTFREADRPYVVNFFGSISALANEQAASRERGMASTQMLVQVMQQLREQGLDEAAIVLVLTAWAGLDEEQAQTLAKAIKAAKPEAPAGMGMPFGGEEGGEEEGFDEEQPQPPVAAPGRNGKPGKPAQQTAEEDTP